MTPGDVNGAMNAPAGGPGHGRSELGQRVVSGIVMGVLALAAVWAGGLVFAAAVTAIGIIVLWEWGRVVRGGGIDAILVAQAVGVVGAVVMTWLGTAGLGLMFIFIAALVSAMVGFGSSGILSAAGAFYAGLPALALVWLRDDTMGLPAVLLIVLAVVATDTGAYASGRTLGGPKLMARVSPNKTWSGLIGGVLAATIVGALFGLPLFGHLSSRLAIDGFALGLVSQIGDLMESAVKREHGVKDASGLIPGHGGFMDRVDGLIVAAVAAAIFGLVVNVHAPARALLNWS